MMLCVKDLWSIFDRICNICLNVNRVRFTFDGHLFNLEIKEWNCLKS